MSFEKEHRKWMEHHLSARKGERLDALKRGHGYGNRLFAEQVWWPLAGGFQGLHPEYEVKDWRGRSYFVDFMWIAGTLRVALEVMDYGSHGMDRTKYRMDLNRGLFLQTQDCVVFYIALDELKENPSFILYALRTSLAPYLSAADGGDKRNTDKGFSRVERELELHNMTVIKYCRRLVEKGKLQPIAKGQSGRVVYYQYVGSLQSPDLV
ncbi:hypothetical protein DQG13_18365 [Paenibacillus sp. YN15]|nr:hypothetical protein DQG13_18365 [Paenibacillus sp. YN15]